MAVWVLHVEGVALETYVVEAESEEEANLQFINGQVTKPVKSEVVDCIVTHTEKQINV